MRGTRAPGRPAGRATVLALLLVGLSAGCRDSGLPDRNLPKAEAEQRTYEYPAYQAADPAPEVWELAGRHWQASGTFENIDATRLRQVASAGGAAVYALSWDAEPYDRLYTPAGENRWRVVLAID